MYKFWEKVPQNEVEVKEVKRHKYTIYNINVNGNYNNFHNIISERYYLIQKV